MSLDGDILRVCANCYSYKGPPVCLITHCNDAHSEFHHLEAALPEDNVCDYHEFRRLARLSPARQQYLASKGWLIQHDEKRMNDHG